MGQNADLQCRMLTYMYHITMKRSGIMKDGHETEYRLIVYYELTFTQHPQMLVCGLFDETQVKYYMYMD